MFRYLLFGLIGLSLLLPNSAFADCPAKFTTDSYEFNIGAGQTFEKTLRDLLIDPVAAEDIQFGFVPVSPAPSWVRLEGGQNQEKMIAEPALGDIGVYNSTLVVSCGTDAGGFATITFNVRITPEWLDNELIIAATEGQPYRLDLRTKIRTQGNLNQTTFSVAGLDKLPWLSLNGSILQGTPRRKDVKNVDNLSFTATDASGGQASIPGRSTVVKVTVPPKWDADPIILSDAEENKAYDAGTDQFVTHTEPEPGNLYPLKYEIVQKSASWIQMDPNTGKVSGTPSFDDSGNATIQAKVSFVEDGKEFSDTTTFQFVVKNTNRVPRWKSKPSFVATEDVRFEESLAAFVEDGDIANEGDSLRFEIIEDLNVPKWLNVTQSGLISGTPAQANVGENKVKVRVRDNANATADTVVTISVQPQNDSPVWSKDTIVLPDAIVGENYSQAIAQFASDPDNTAAELRFAKVDTTQAPWSQVDAQGTISGRPKKSDEGDYKFEVRVQDPGGLSAIVNVIVKVKFINSPPVWSEEPSFTATEDVEFQTDLSTFVSDKDIPEGDALTFRVESSPTGHTWARISTDGKSFGGTPRQKDVGTTKFVILVKDSFGGEARATVTVNVQPVNDPPVWTADPVKLPDAIIGKAYNQSLSAFVNDPDNTLAELTFEKVANSGAGWASVSPNGQVTGTPQKADEGKNTFQVRVSDPENLSASATIEINVKFVNTPPQWTADPTFEGTEDVAFSENIAPFATDIDLPQGDSLRFTLIDPPADGWATLSADGMLTGTPLQKHVGRNRFKVRVTDNSNASADAVVTVNVKAVNDAPSWTQNPIQLPDATVAQNYNEGLSSFVVDPDNTLAELTFEKVPGSGAAWANVDARGNVTGKPEKTDEGPHQFQVKVTDPGNLSAVVGVQVTVIRPTFAPKWTKNPVVLPDAFFGKDYSASLAAFVQDPDNGINELVITKVVGSGTEWASVASNGAVTGKPLEIHLGLNEFEAVVTDPDNLSSTAKVQITVKDPTVGPSWTKNPIDLGSTVAGKAFNFDLKPFLQDPDTPISQLECRKKTGTGPAWLTVNSNCTLSGTPSDSDVGNYQSGFIVTDGRKEAETVGQGKVVPDTVGPKWTQNPIPLGETVVGRVFNFDLKPFLEDPDTPISQLECRKKTGAGPAWLTVNSNCTLSGTPQVADLGAYTSAFIVSDGTKEAETAGEGTVVDTAAPKWTKNPIPLGEVLVGTNFEFDLKPFLEDADTPVTQLECRKKTGAGPLWLKVKQDCTVSGIPETADLGAYTTIFVVSDGTKEAEADGEGTVVDTAGPQWTKNPIPLGQAIVGQLFTFDLKPFLKDDDTPVAQLTCRQKAGVGPTWMTVNSDCTISGTPKIADVGSYTTTFVVSDGSKEAETDGEGIVIKGNRPPIIAGDILLKVKEDEVLTKDLHDPAYFWDADGDELTCMALDSLDFVRLAEDCTITLKPKNKDIGFHTYKVRVSDGQDTTEGIIGIEVIEDAGNGPYWKEDPIELVAQANKPFEFCVGDKAVEPNGARLKFACAGEPFFVACDTAGCMRGTATDSDIKLHKFTMSATNGTKSASTNIHLKVIEGGHSKKIRIGDAVPGARVENLWLVDSSPYSCNLSKKLYNCIHVYYEKLKQAQIHHTGLFVSTDARPRPEGFAGRPITYNGKSVMSWQDTDLVYGFRRRMEVSYSNNKYNTPMWASHLFYNVLPTLTKVYKKTFFEPNVPMDAITVTCQRDNYARFTGGYTPERFAEEFSELHENENKSYRFSAMAPAPSQLDNNGTSSSVGPADTYERVISETGGTYYQRDLISQMGTHLRDYADKVILNAYIQAKREILLDPPAKDPASITVTLANTPLTGNTGSPDDQWEYQASPSAVIIHWNKIDMTNLDPSDLLIIEYSGRRLPLS